MIYLLFFVSENEVEGYLMFDSIKDLVGNTPMVQLSRFTSELKLSGHLYAKCEFLNPTGSMKDRIALAMILNAIDSGKLKPGGTIIEPTSGNTGIGLAAIGAQMGFRVVIVMPSSMSEERRKMMAIYGAELVLTPAEEGMSGAIEKAEELLAEDDNAIIAGQFTNPINAQAHYSTTGPEIWQEVGNRIDVLVAGVGTGGSLTGTARFLKEQKNDIHVIAVEPENSAVLSGGAAGAHGLQGIGAGFIPSVMDVSVLDSVVPVDDETAAEMVRILAKKEGLFCGISSGAALAGAVSWMREHPGSHVVVLLPDSGSRYLSSELIFDS